MNSSSIHFYKDINICPVLSEFLTWSFVYKTLDTLAKTINENQIQAHLFPI